MNPAGISKGGTQVSTITTFPANKKTHTGVVVNEGASTTNGYFMNCLLKDASGNIISKNSYARGKIGNWSQLKTMKTLPKCVVSANGDLWGIFTTTQNGSAITITGSLTNKTSNKVAHMVRLTLLKRGVVESGSGESYVDPRILPVVFNRNYFTLFPGESLPVTMQFDLKDAGGFQPDLEITGFTVNDAVIQLDNVGTGKGQLAGQPKNAAPFVTCYSLSKGIVINSSKKGSYTVSLFNMLGKQVASVQSVGNQIVVRGMPGGLYVVKIATEKGTQITHQRVMVP